MDEERRPRNGRFAPWRRIGVPFGLGLVVLATAYGAGSTWLSPQRAAIPFPVPVYQIVGHSGSHEISLLNLPLTYVGAPQVPIPVDVDGDLLPDVTVALNLVNVPEGLLNNPPDVGELIAPNLEINRLLTAPILGQKSPPLRLEVVLTLEDLEGGPSTTIQVGYDTGPGGSIPTYWKGLLGGLDSFFNPLEVILDTRAPLPDQWEPASYRGPLSIVGSVDAEESLLAEFDLHYDPLPNDIRVSMLNDDDGMHVTYNHSAPREVDLTTTVHLAPADGSTTDVVARIDRLPDNIAVDMFTGEGVGDLVYRSNSDGRAPDVGASIVVTPPPDSDDNPLRIDADIEGLPSAMHGHWEIPADDQMSFHFEASGDGVGAIQAEVRDYLGPDPAGFTFVPTEQQYATYHKEGEQSLIRARVERIRQVDFVQLEDGIDASLDVGDGELPFEVKIVHDDFDQEGTAIDARAVVSPLPDQIGFSMRTPEPGTVGEPLELVYDASESVDIDADFRIVEPDTSPTTCGTPGVLCADLGIRHLPVHIDATIVNVTALDTRIAVNMEPRPGAALPDVFANVLMAQKPEEEDDPVPEPIVGEVALYQIPEEMSIRLVNRVLDEGTFEEREALERLEFHACEWDYDAETPACVGDEGRIAAIDFAVRNFFTGAPLPPLLPETPLWVTVVGRGGAQPTDPVRFEAKGHITDFAELQLLTNDDLFGLRTEIGGGQPLSALVDLGDVPLVFQEEPTLIYHRLDLEASATVNPLPATLDFCFQQKDRPVLTTPTTPFTAPCQNPDPFGDEDGVGPADRSPLAIAYRAPTKFDVLTRVALNEKGATNSISDDQHVRGYVDVYNLPGDFTAFVDSPPDDENGDPTEGPLRVTYDAPPPIGVDQIRVEFGVEATDADMVCQDPRPAALGKMALCAEAVIHNLPTHVDLFYDPTDSSENFVFDSSGSELIDITDLSASLVQGDLVDNNDPQTPNDESDDDLETTVLVASGYLLDLPRSVEGTLILPGTVDLTASPPIGTVDITVRNFIGPDPLPSDVPDQRAGVPGPAVADQRFTVFQRGDFFRAHAHVTDLRGMAFATSRDAANPKKLLDTTVIRVAFGDPSQTVRAYADLQFLSDEDDPTSLVSIIGDITLQHVPQEMTLCIRGKKNIAGTPATPTFCDRAPTSDDEGAFQFVGNPGTSSDLLDVYAFVRFAKAGGTDVLAARADLIDIPNVVEGTFRTEGVRFDSFAGLGPDGDGETPFGIGAIDFELADFDIDTHGYSGTPPWGGDSREGTVDPFPGPAPAGQHLRLHTNDADVHVRGRVHALQSVLFGQDPCAAPSPAPDDYPYYPIGLGEEYTCVRAQFENDSTDSLDIAMIIDRGETRIALHDAGLTSIPDFVQATIAKAETLNVDSSLRAPCPPASTDPGNVSCMPPLLRFDSSGNSELFGMLEVGQPGDLDDLRSYVPRGDLANLDTPPADWSDWGPDNTGVRLRLVNFGTGNESEADDRSGITAGIRLVIPRSLTVDQMQSWTDPADPNVREASDVRFRYVVRDENGDVEPRIGELAALIHDADKGDQILVSDDDNVLRGLTIPGELGLTMFMRHQVVLEENGCDTCFDRMFIQIDGRVSAPIDAKVRILGGSEASIQNIAADIRDVPPTPAGDEGTEPSFRLRVEMNKKVGEPGLSGVEEALLCIVFCVQTQIDLEALNAEFDFDPNNSGEYARLVNAYINMDGSDNAVEIRGYSDIDGNSPNGIGEGTEEIDAAVHIHINPMIVFLHIGVNPILGLDLFLGGELTVDAEIDRAREFRINNSLLHLVLEHEGNGNGTEVAVNMYPYGLFAASFLWLFFIPPIPLYVATFLPPSLPPSAGIPAPAPLGPAIIDFMPCPGSTWGGSFADNIIDLEPGDHLDLTAWFSILEIRYIRFGLLVPLVDFLVPLIFCAIGADLPLMDESHPGAPFEPDNHPIEGLEGVVAADPPIPPLPEPPHLVVSSGEDLALCGTPAFVDAHVQSGGTLRVATATNTATIPGTEDNPQQQCPAGQAGRLELNAGEFIEIDGDVVGPATGTGELILTSAHVFVDDGGVVQATQGKVTLQASGDLDIEGQVLADELVTANSSGATGGGGAGHGGDGGAGGGGSGGTAYGDTTFDPANPDPPDETTGVIPIEAGAAGSASVGTAGLGGGQIALQGTNVTVSSSGVVSANGGDGSDNHVGGEHCAISVHFPDDGDEENGDQSHTDVHPNNGQPGAGGGSGGAIFIRGTRVTIEGTVSATGGDGGSGIMGGGGGGSGGIVKISAALYDDTVDVGFGDGGSSTCPPPPPTSAFPGSDSVTNVANPEFPHGADGQDGQALVELGPHSSVTPLGAFWNRAEAGAALEVPYAAASPLRAAGTTNQVVLCAVRRPPESFRIDDEDDEDANDIDIPTGTDVLNPCGTVAADATPSTVIELADANIPGEEAPATAHFDVTLTDGYYGFYTRVLRPATPGNDCTNHGDVAILPFVTGSQYDQFDCDMELLPLDLDAASGIDNTNPTVTVEAPEGSDSAAVAIEVSGIADNMAPDDANFGENPLLNLSGVLAVECGTDNVNWTECGPGLRPVTFSGNGTNTVYVRVTDVAGNQTTATDTTNVDTVAPTSVASRVPGVPASGWYQTTPTFEISGFNDFGGSGQPTTNFYEWWFDGGTPTPCSDDPCVVSETLTTGQHEFHWRAIDVAGNRQADQTLSVNVDDDTPDSALLSVPGAPDGENGWFTREPFVVISAVDQPGASGLDDGDGPAGIFVSIDDPVPTEEQTDFLTVPPGEHVVYWQVVDVAGNSTGIMSQPFKVDHAPPVTTIVNVGPDGLNGWHVNAPVVSLEVTDSSPGSTVDAGTEPSGTFWSIDDGPIVAYEGPITVGEGFHSVTAYAVDVSGQRSAIVRREYRVDLSDPVTVLRTTPPEPAQNNWWRTTPSNVLRAADGDQNAGVTGIEYNLNGSGFVEYTMPFDVPDGVNTIQWLTTDASGRSRGTRDIVERVDPTPPTAVALHSNPTVYIRSRLLHLLLGIPLNANLYWQVGDANSPQVDVTVLIYNAAGQVVRRLEHGPVNVTPGVPTTGYTVWDGRDLRLTGLVPAGVYYYRVVVTDLAGNTAQSGESRPITIRVTLL